ncbi:MAG: prepilin-type N-terminal cleavage/methylation domain-containing protein [Candidatus Azambacteria bacterium]|nr:prepilin-type N-terminal cleavage/methylation domain-containing protein [Candidatus Azambacteria bacterium]
MFRNKKEKGFTLLELLVVIGIIGLLSSIIVVNLTGARKKARDVKRVADIRTIQTALESYYGKNGQYPTAIQGLVGATAELPARPKDPIAAATTDCATAQSDACYFYAYVTPTGAVGPQSYHIGASLEELGSSLLNQDTDCISSAANTTCPVSSAYTNGFNGAQVAGCGSTASRECYDIAQ